MEMRLMKKLGDRSLRSLLAVLAATASATVILGMHPEAAQARARAAPAAPQRLNDSSAAPKAVPASSCAVLRFRLQQGPADSRVDFGVGCAGWSLVTVAIAHYTAGGQLLNYGDYTQTVPPGVPWYRITTLSPLPSNAYWTCAGLWDDSTGTNLIWQCI
jgi:hypothetical protein